MSLVTLESLYDQILLHAKKCSTPAVDIALRRAAREVCARTKVRRESISINILAGQNWYALASPDSDEEVLKIQAAQYNVPNSTCRIPMDPTTPEDMGGGGVTASYPCVFYLEPPSRIVIGPAAAVTSTVTGGLYVRCILQPTLTAQTLDSSILQFADRVVTDGALAHLLTMNDEPWYNAPLAAKFKAEFEIGLRRTKAEAERAYMQTEVYTTVHRF